MCVCVRKYKKWTVCQIFLQKRFYQFKPVPSRLGMCLSTPSPEPLQTWTQPHSPYTHNQLSPLHLTFPTSFSFRHSPHAGLTDHTGHGAHMTCSEIGRWQAMGKTLKDCQVRQVLNWAASWTMCRQVTCYFQSLGGLTKDPAHITHHCILQPQCSA